MEALTMQGGAKIRDACEALKDVLDDFNIVFTDQGIHINSLDVNGVALVNATFWKHAFQRFMCAKTFVCGLNMAVLYKTFKLVGKSTQLTLRIDERYPTALYVCMENAGTGLKIEVTLKIWGSDKKMLKIENSIFDRYITIPSADFQSLIGYISNFQNSGDDDNKILDIELNNGALVLSSRGQFGVTRVSVQETNTGMNVSNGKIDALNDELVRVDVDAEEAAMAERAAAAADKASGKPSGPSKKKKKTIVDREVKDEPVNDGGEAQQPDATLDDLGGSKRRRNDGDDNDPDGDGDDASIADAVVPVTSGAIGALAASGMSGAVTGAAPEADEKLPPVKNSYNLKYIRYFTKATTLSTVTRIFLRPDYPIIVMYNVGSMGVLRFCLGPASIDDEDMDDDQVDKDDDDGPAAE